MRLVPGLVFTAPGITGDQDHPCILLTDDFTLDEQVIVNLTDFRNIMGPRADLPAGTRLAPSFLVSKRSTIHFGYARRYGTEELFDLLGDLRASLYGPCDPAWLETFRIELFESEDTPPDVINFCIDLEWGL